MNGDVIAVVLGAFSLAVILVYFIWKRRLKKAQLRQFSEEFAEEEVRR